MNLRKGFLRLTLILSVLFGILTLIFLNDIFNDSSLLNGSRNIKITIPLPSDWENKTLPQKMNSIDELLIFLPSDGEKSGTLKESWDSLRRAMGRDDYSLLTSKEKQNIKRRLRDQIISDEKRPPKDRERRNYYVSSGPDWRELSFLIFIRFAIGFVSSWLIYAFIRWVVFYFVVGGFKAKSSKGGETG
jgi:hypothetical protein